MNVGFEQVKQYNITIELSAAEAELLVDQLRTRCIQYNLITDLVKNINFNLEQFQEQEHALVGSVDLP